MKTEKNIMIQPMKRKQTSLPSVNINEEPAL